VSREKENSPLDREGVDADFRAKKPGLCTVLVAAHRFSVYNSF
jgi:hypothetical protein